MNYPTELELEAIRKWDGGDLHGLMEYVNIHWAFVERGWEQDGDIYTLITSGWSGNEEIIAALQDNILFWALYWEQSNRGGKHVFMKLTFENMKKMEPR